MIGIKSLPLLEFVDDCVIFHWESAALPGSAVVHFRLLWSVGLHNPLDFLSILEMTL